MFLVVFENSVCYLQPVHFKKYVVEVLVSYHHHVVTVIFVELLLRFEKMLMYGIRKHGLVETRRYVQMWRAIKDQSSKTRCY